MITILVNIIILVTMMIGMALEIRKLGGDTFWPSLIR